MKIGRGIGLHLTLFKMVFIKTKTQGVNKRVAEESEDETDSTTINFKEDFCSF